MTAPTTPPVFEMKLKALAPKDVWTLHVNDDGRRLTIVPESIEVRMWKPLKADARFYIVVGGRVVRQSDGQLTGNRRSAAFRFDEDGESVWNDRPLSGTPSLDPELRAFAIEARHRIEAALAWAVAS